MYINLPDLSSYQHSRGETTVKFPLYAGKKWSETIGSRHSWTVVVKVLRVGTITSGGANDLQALLQIFSEPWGGGELEKIGDCTYSSVRRTIISCS